MLCEALGSFGEALGGFGRLWEALGRLGEALEAFGQYLDYLPTLCLRSSVLARDILEI